MDANPAAHRLHVTIHDAVGDSYPVELTRVDAGGVILQTRTGDFPRALPDLPSIVAPGASAPEIGKAGLALFAMLDTAGLSALWHSPAPCRLVLDVRAQELEVLPWELLRSPQGV